MCKTTNKDTDIFSRTLNTETPKVGGVCPGEARLLLLQSMRDFFLSN